MPQRVVTRELIERLIASGASRRLVEFALKARLADERDWTRRMLQRARELE